MDGDPLGDVGVVVVTYRSASTVAATLAALPKARLGDLVVVDNGSDDGTASLVRATGTRVVEQDNNGFGAGCNRGERELGAGSPFVLFLNPDAVLRPDALEALVRHLVGHPRCAVVGPRVVQGQAPSWSAGRLATLGTEMRPLLPHPLSRLGPHLRLAPGTERTGPVGYVEGGCFLARRADLRAVGGFDEGYFLYFEEQELARRLHRHGLEVHLCTDAVVDHRIGASRRGLPAAGEEHLVASRVRYLRRWEGDRAARAWVRAARASWALRAATGRLPGEDRALLTAAAGRALSHPSPPPAP